MSAGKPTTAPIELKFKNLNDQGFIGSLKGLVNHKWEDMTTAYRLKRLLDKVDSESKRAQEFWQEQFKKIELVEENGQKTPKDVKAFEEMQKSFLETPCEMGNRQKFHINSFIGYKFSAVEMLALEPILAGLEELENEGGDNGEEKH